jgi:DMSO/TMAO reductase YedYZ molybdopterin-dependent catalytic subunit
VTRRTWIVTLLFIAVPIIHAQTSTVRVGGDVSHPLTLTARDLATMPRATIKAASHDQDGSYEGVTIREILTRAGVPAGDALRGAELAKAVVITGADGYRVAFGVAEFDDAFTDRQAILADKKDGAPLAGNAAPFQLVMTGEKRPARWVRQVVSIDIVTLPAGR